MSDSNRIEMVYAEEAVAGSALATAISGSAGYGADAPDDRAVEYVGTMRLTGESLTMDTTMKASDEIRADRQISDVIRTSIRTGGSINFELTHSGRWPSRTVPTPTACSRCRT